MTPRGEQPTNRRGKKGPSVRASAPSLAAPAARDAPAAPAAPGACAPLTPLAAVFACALLFNLATGGRGVELGTRLGGAGAAALAVTLAFQLARRVGGAARAAALVAALATCATLLWPAARHSALPALQAALYTALVEALVAGAPARAGASAGALAVSEPLLGLVALGAAGVLHRDRRALARFSVAAAPFLVVAAVLFVRAPAAPRLDGHLVDGLWGIFLSPGKGIFFYSPPLLVAAGLWSRAPRALNLALAATVGPVVAARAFDPAWGEGATYGLPGMVFFLPAALVPLVFADGRAPKIAVGAAAVLGFLVELAAVTVPPGAWDAIAHDVGDAWLGHPDLAGSPLPCRACFEETHRSDWLPPFQPILGQWWLVRHLLSGDDYAHAEPDAPWHRYTSLVLAADLPYAAARHDLWLLELAERAP
jgi:hypothetical protein